MKIEQLSLEEKMQLYFSISRIFEGDYCPECDEERLESYEEDDNAMAKAIASDNHFFKTYFEGARDFFYEGSVYSDENGDEYSQYNSPEEALIALYPNEYQILKDLDFFGHIYQDCFDEIPDGLQKINVLETVFRDEKMVKEY